MQTTLAELSDLKIKTLLLCTFLVISMPTIASEYNIGDSFYILEKTTDRYTFFYKTPFGILLPLPQLLELVLLIIIIEIISTIIKTYVCRTFLLPTLPSSHHDNSFLLPSLHKSTVFYKNRILSSFYHRSYQGSLFNIINKVRNT